MEKLFIVGPRRLAGGVLQDLQRAGVVQIDPLPAEEVEEYHLDTAEDALLKRWDAVALAADHSLRLVGLHPDHGRKPFEGNLDLAESESAAFESRAAELVERQGRLREEIELIGQFSRVVDLLAQAAHGLDRSPRLAVMPFLLSGEDELAPLTRDLEEALDERFLLSHRSVDGRVAAVIVTLKGDADEARGVLGRLGLSELPRPGGYAWMSLQAMAERLAERRRTAPGELGAAEGELRGLVHDAGARLQALWNRARNESARLRALSSMNAGRYGFALFGWVPVRSKHRVAAVIEQYEGRLQCDFVAVQTIQEAEHVPVMLENPGWVRPFESLIRFLNTPRYDSWDPSWVVAAFFPLWFGMIVGDIGYGLVFAAAAWYLQGYIRRGRALSVDFFKLRLSPQALTQVVQVLWPMILWTLVWGFFYGEFFGSLLEHAGFFGTGGHSGLIPVLIPRTDTARTASPLILVSIAFGICQVLYGFYLKARRTHRSGERKHFWEAGGYFGGVSALVLFSWSFMTGDYSPWLMIPTIAGAAVFMAGTLLARMPMMLAELPTQAGHILSYIRIYAVGLASAILADLATNMGFALYHQLGSAGLVIGVLVGLMLSLVIHALLVVLLTVGHVLQPIRLIWVEFFTKFDFYTVSGRPFRPFSTIGGAP